MPDWIDSYMAEMSTVPSPKIYKLWSAITAISGVLERKVWTSGSAKPIYPNLFTVLVGPPASGKTNAIGPIRELWGKVKDLHVAPDNVTKAALIDALSRSIRTIQESSSQMTIFSAMAVACSELGVFLTHHDLEFLSVLNNIYDSPISYREERRTSGIIEITKPYLVMLAGTQPDFLNSLLPDEAWGMGFTSRLIMIYADSGEPTSIFGKNLAKKSSLSNELSKIFTYRGEFIWTQQAMDEVDAWNMAGCPPAPTHNKLIHYTKRRNLYLVKLSMVSSASRSGEMTVTIDDVERARDWLIDCEKVMPDIFRAMGQRSDQQIIGDLHFYAYKLWSSVALDKRKPIPMKELYKFLHTRVPSDKITRIIEVAERSGYFRKGPYPDEWIPEPLNKITNL